MKNIKSFIERKMERDNSKKRVLILMSTYNGEKYIEEQLKSIQKQNYSNQMLMIRDDGSTDGTLEIIQNYQKRDMDICLLSGENLGVCESYFALLKAANKKADYYALADQDDYWLPDKISAAVQKIEREVDKKNPILYAGNKILVDEKLNRIHSKVTYLSEYVPSFGNALVQNICTGCTCVINQALLSLICAHIPKEKVIMHDWWIYLVASAFGTVIYDKDSYILYRQHKNNVHGTIVTRRALFFHRIREFCKKRGDIYRQVYIFQKNFLLTFEQMYMVKLVLGAQRSFLGKWILLQEKRIGRQGKGQKMVYIGLVLLGKL